MLLSGIESSFELSGTCIDFLKEANSWIGQNIYREWATRDARGEGLPFIKKTLSLLPPFIDWSTKYEKTTHMTNCHTRYSETIADGPEDIRQRLFGEKHLGSL